MIHFRLSLGFVKLHTNSELKNLLVRNEQHHYDELYVTSHSSIYRPTTSLSMVHQVHTQNTALCFSDNKWWPVKFKWQPPDNFK